MLVLLAPAAPGAAGPEARVATVKTLSGPAKVERAGGTLALAIGMDRLQIDRFRFGRATQGGEFDATLSRGRTAVVPGRIAKSQVDAMKVRTPEGVDEPRNRRVEIRAR